MTTPTDIQFRAAGYTAAAREYPLSETAFVWVCRYNGITPANCTNPAWRYAPNRATQLRVECPVIRSEYDRKKGQK